MTRRIKKSELEGALKRLNGMLEDEKTNYRYEIFVPWSTALIAKKTIGEDGIHSMTVTTGTQTELYYFVHTMIETLEHYIDFKKSQNK